MARVTQAAAINAAKDMAAVLGGHWVGEAIKEPPGTVKPIRTVDPARLVEVTTGATIYVTAPVVTKEKFLLVIDAMYDLSHAQQQDMELSQDAMTSYHMRVGSLRSAESIVDQMRRQKFPDKARAVALALQECVEQWRQRRAAQVVTLRWSEVVSHQATIALPDWGLKRSHVDPDPNCEAVWNALAQLVTDNPESTKIGSVLTSVQCDNQVDDDAVVVTPQHR